MSKCDVADCENEAEQHFILDGGDGPTVDRCPEHSVPSVDVMPSWQIPDQPKKTAKKTAKKN